MSGRKIPFYTEHSEIFLTFEQHNKLYHWLGYSAHGAPSKERPPSCQEMAPARVAAQNKLWNTLQQNMDAG